MGQTSSDTCINNQHSKRQHYSIVWNRSAVEKSFRQGMHVVAQHLPTIRMVVTWLTQMLVAADPNQNLVLSGIPNFMGTYRANNTFCSIELSGTRHSRNGS
jgi:hypothetical protein